jgi:uncharacterized protein (TIGR02246 family)
VDLQETLLDFERRLSEGDADHYRELLSDDATVVVPGMALDKDACVAAIEEADGWDDVVMDDVRLTTPADDVAAVTYRFSGRRGEAAPYVALMSSVYVVRDGRWRLALHQQTPL